jgi:hypothetical protein
LLANNADLLKRPGAGFAQREVLADGQAAHIQPAEQKAEKLGSAQARNVWSNANVKTKSWPLCARSNLFSSSQVR